jgi:hypothetical protein
VSGVAATLVRLLLTVAPGWSAALAAALGGLRRLRMLAVRLSPWGRPLPPVPLSPPPPALRYVQWELGLPTARGVSRDWPRRLLAILALPAGPGGGHCAYGAGVLRTNVARLARLAVRRGWDPVIGPAPRAGSEAAGGSDPGPPPSSPSAPGGAPPPPPDRRPASARDGGRTDRRPPPRR